MVHDDAVDGGLEAALRESLHVDLSDDASGLVGWDEETQPSWQRQHRSSTSTTRASSIGAVVDVARLHAKDAAKK